MIGDRGIHQAIEMAISAMDPLYLVATEKDGKPTLRRYSMTVFAKKSLFNLDPSACKIFPPQRLAGEFNEIENLGDASVPDLTTAAPMA